MFLRTLFGSRMPQAQHPRADPQISSYWQDDTSSAQEIARAIREAEMENAPEDELNKKPHAVVTALDEITPATGRHLSSLRRSLPQLALHLEPVGVDNVASLNVDDLDNLSPLQSQVSPTGLISIAAADIDEAQSQPQPGVNAELDWEYIEALRNSVAPSQDRSVTAEDVLRQLLHPAANTSLSPAEHEAQSKRRFLSLLRRINELRSQQIETEEWDGLPYPQIMALPTFKYAVRERTEETTTTPEDPTYNTLCAVCYTEYAPEEEVRALPCLHFYHRECIDQWLMHHRICPICKHVVAVY